MERNIKDALCSLPNCLTFAETEGWLGGAMVLGKMAPCRDSDFAVENVRVVLFSTEYLGRKENHANILDRHTHISLGRKQEIADSHGGSQV